MNAIYNDRANGASSRAASDGLSLSKLSIAYRVKGILQPVLHDVSLEIAPGESYGLVGESGCGKSTAALAAVRYLPANGVVQSGSIFVAGHDLMSLDKANLRALRASSISMVYQNPGRALNPTMSIERQLVEAFSENALSPARARSEAVEMLKRVRISSPSRVMQSYPHQLSGGMQQRVVIAMALANQPSVLILDEPTTGLDVTVESEILRLINSLRHEFRTAVLLISHNLAVVREVCDKVGVLYAGRLVEQGSTAEVLGAPRHPYTAALLRCLPGSQYAPRNKYSGALATIPGNLPKASEGLCGCRFAPRCAKADSTCHSSVPPWIHDGSNGNSVSCFHPEEIVEKQNHEPPLEQDSVGSTLKSAPFALQANHLSKTFRVRGATLYAVHDVSLELPRGQTLGLVGESGSGKTTLAKMLLGLTRPDEGGLITVGGQVVKSDATKRSREQLKALQVVFQNPDTSMNRAHTILQLLKRSVSKLNTAKDVKIYDRISELVQSVRLPASYLALRTHHLSGGLKQRVAIARAFAGEPKVVICDEPTSALDVSVQAAVLNLLADLQRTKGVGYLLISHDLNVIRYLSDRIAVLYLGRLLEVGTAAEVFDGPRHPYTESLLSSLPASDIVAGGASARVAITGEPPDPTQLPKGCIFHTRCPRKLGEICEIEPPPFVEASESHRIRCHISVIDLKRLQSPTPAIDR